MSEGLQTEMSLQESCLDALHHMSVEVTALIDKTNELEARNAELEKLVQAFDWCTENLDNPYECDRCPLKQSNPMTPECVLMMRKLGIRRSNGL